MDECDLYLNDFIVYVEQSGRMDRFGGEKDLYIIIL